jgi:phospholipid/cholesterol/gamma-HCH transport system substrate-binding protein
VLNQQRGLLVGTLQSLNRLSDVGTDVIRRSQANTVADLRALQPILRNLVEAGDALPGSLQILLTIPFADRSLDVIKGDFANINVRLELDLQAILTNILNSPAVPGVDTIFKMLQSPGTTPLGGADATADADASGGGSSRTPGLTPALPGLSGGNGG